MQMRVHVCVCTRVCVYARVRVYASCGCQCDNIDIDVDIDVDIDSHEASHFRPKGAAHDLAGHGSRKPPQLQLPQVYHHANRRV